MEREAVVEAVGGELREVLDGLRHLFWEELDLDRALAGVERRLCHAPTLPASRGVPAEGVKRAPEPCLAALTSGQHLGVEMPAYTP